MKTAFRIFLVLGLTWILVRAGIYLLPGDPASFLVHESLVPLSADVIREQMNLNHSWIDRIFSLPSPVSLITHQNVISTLELSLLHSLILTSLTIFLGGVISVYLLYLSFISESTRKIAETFSVLMSGIPLFVLGPFLLLIFSLKLKLFPVVQSPLLPALALGLYQAAYWYRILSHKIERTQHESAVPGARARGLSERTIFFNYVLYPSLGSFMGFFGTQLGTLMNGSILMEVIFQWNGMGLLLADSVSTRDYPVIEICVICMAGLALASQQLGNAIQRKVSPQLR